MWTRASRRMRSLRLRRASTAGFRGRGHSTSPRPSTCGRRGVARVQGRGPELTAAGPPRDWLAAGGRARTRPRPLRLPRAGRARRRVVATPGSARSRRRSSPGRRPPQPRRRCRPRPRPGAHLQGRAGQGREGHMRLSKACPEGPSTRPAPARGPGLTQGLQGRLHAQVDLVLLLGLQGQQRRVRGAPGRPPSARASPGPADSPAATGAAPAPAAPPSPRRSPRGPPGAAPGPTPAPSSP